MGKSPAQKALIFQQFEAFFPRLMDMVTAGYPLSRAVKSLPVPVDTGAFVRWLYKDSERTAIYEEAKKYRTEVWAGELIKHATADEDNEGNTYTHDTSRSRLIVDTYKFLMGADNRKQYGDTKTIDVNQTVSVKLALEKADNRLLNVIDLTDDDVEVIPVSDYKRLSEPSGPAWEDDDDEL